MLLRIMSLGAAALLQTVFSRFVFQPVLHGFEIKGMISSKSYLHHFL